MTPQEPRSEAALAADKAALRTAARRRIAAIPTDRWDSWGAGMAAQLLANPLWQRAHSVFCFVSLPQEPDTTALLQAALDGGKRLCVPRVLGAGRMEAVELPAFSALRPGVMGLLEPDDALQHTLAPGEIDLALIPCLTAAENGARLGRGSGYYDRFLAAYPHTAVLLCAEALLTPAAELPAGPLDVPVPFLLTEKRFFAAGR